jgi:hypothetical protein
MPKLPNPVTKKKNVQRAPKAFPRFQSDMFKRVKVRRRPFVGRSAARATPRGTESHQPQRARPTDAVDGDWVVAGTLRRTLRAGCTAASNSGPIDVVQQQPSRAPPLTLFRSPTAPLSPPQPAGVVAQAPGY